MALRILCLHGKGGNSDIFSKTLQPLIENSKVVGNFEWIFLNAPHPMPSRGFQWWTLPEGVRSFEALEYPGIEASLDSINKECPFDVVIGHSQGAILASLLLARPQQYPNIKAAILSGAAYPRPYTDEIEGAALLSPKRKLNSLHAIAENDVINPPSDARRVCKIFNGKEFSHTGGHVFPVAPAAIEKYCKLLNELSS